MFLNLLRLDVISRSDDRNSIESSSQVDDNFSISMIIYYFILSNVSSLHHYIKESTDDFGRGSDQYLSLSSSLGIVYGIQGISQDTHSNHDDSEVM